MTDATSAPRTCQSCCWWTKSAASYWGMCEKVQSDRGIYTSEDTSSQVASLVVVLRTIADHHCGMWGKK